MRPGRGGGPLAREGREEEETDAAQEVRQDTRSDGYVVGGYEVGWIITIEEEEVRQDARSGVEGS